MARRKATSIDAIGRVVPTRRRGFGSVRQLPSGNLQASYRGPDGQRHTAERTFATSTDADAWLAQIHDQIRRETWKPPTVIRADLFGEYARAWISQRRSRKGAPLRPTTRRGYTDAVGRGLAPFANTRLRDISGPAVRSWHAGRARDAGATMAGAEAKVLRSVLRTAVKDGLIESCPVPSELCVSRTGRDHRPPTPEELAVLIATIAPRFRLAVQIAAFGGLRLGEWRALRRNDVMLAGQNYLVTVARQAVRVDGKWIVGPVKSDEGNRDITLPAWLTDDVTEHLAKYVGPFPADLLFPSGGTGEFVDISWRRAWDKARDAAGVRAVVREHDLRHYFGSSLAAAGLGIRQLQSALGHGSAAASLGYLHAARGTDATTADLLQPPPAPAKSNVASITGGRR